MPFYSYNFVLLAACAIFFYKAGTIDEDAGPMWGLLWAALSVVISFMVWRGLGWGLLPMIATQVVLFFGIAVVRVLREKK